MKSVNLVIRACIVYGSLSIGFSMIGFFLLSEFGLRLPVPTIVPVEQVIKFVSVEHIMGHIVWGMIVGVATLSLRYTVLAGLFAILIDSDNLLKFLDLMAVSRMAHSIPFGIMAAAIMMLVFGKKDWRLGSIAFVAVLAHISFDTLSGRTTSFPLLTPFYNEKFFFHGIDWIFILIIGIAIVGLVTLFVRKKISWGIKKQTKSSSSTSFYVDDQD